MLQLIITLLIALGTIGNTEDFNNLSDTQQQEYFDTYVSEEIITDIIEGMEGGN